MMVRLNTTGFCEDILAMGRPGLNVISGHDCDRGTSNCDDVHTKCFDFCADMPTPQSPLSLTQLGYASTPASVFEVESATCSIYWEFTCNFVVLVVMCVVNSVHVPVCIELLERLFNVSSKEASSTYIPCNSLE